MDLAAVGVLCGAAAAVGLVWWDLHAPPTRTDYMDPQADRAFRARTGDRR